MLRVLILLLLGFSANSYAHFTGDLMLDAMHHWFSLHHGIVIVVALILAGLLLLRKYLYKK